MTEDLVTPQAGSLRKPGRKQSNQLLLLHDTFFLLVSENLPILSASDS